MVDAAGESSSAYRPANVWAFSNELSCSGCRRDASAVGAAWGADLGLRPAEDCRDSADE
ncbi:hypothetical protein ACFCW6_19755 [Streptomyces sp. NPDC056333]|uniref:hypothetical protein n=1 Tax=Streptomyces sp. NPDC056333 TaxID=3345786 RepID=UPI0035E36E09